MKSNLEKWNYYLSIINGKTDAFITTQKVGKTIPDAYYFVYPIGKITERTITGIRYSHNKHGGRTFFTGKIPSRDEVAAIAKYSMMDIPFSSDNIWLGYTEIWDKEKGYKSSSSVKFNDVVNQVGLFYSLSDAEIHSQKVLEENRIEKEFREQHKKDGGYNYSANGYKFLGWQNGWKHVYYDEDGKLCSETGKPHKSFGYTKEDYPEYKNCIDLKHRRIEVHHNSRGSENTVSCPICKIYWKYDSSD